MSESEVKYDGWAIKYHWTDRLFPPVWNSKSALIRYYEHGVKGLWRRNRKKGLIKAVKVRIVKVSE